MDFINSVIKANKKVLELLSENKLILKKELNIGAGGDVSRVVDMEAEKIFVEYLEKFGQIISEESGTIGEGEDRIIIDPVDGSENFISGMPYFGSSVARERNGKVFESVVVNFATGDLFVKQNEDFKKANIYKENFSEVISNNYATIGIYERAYASKGFVCEVNKKGFKYRSPGALALSLANAHNFNFVIFEGKIREYDVAAGLHMCSDINISFEDNILVISKDKEIFDKLITIARGIK
jgi:myo-inositol-1(or 4)-monophosphatase